MTEKQYSDMINRIKKNQQMEKALIFLCEYIPKFIIIIYILSIMYLFIFRNNIIYKFIMIPAIDLIFVSVFRKIINSKRPYENYDYKPIGRYKEDKGESFPSRHTSSAVIIAIACCYINPVFGLVMWGLALIVGLTRVLCGVHYPKDVIGGLIISCIIGYIGFVFKF